MKERLNEEREYYRKRLNIFVTQILLAPQEYDLHAILPIMRRNLQKFKLLGYYDEMDIFQMVYERASDKIRNKEDFKIENMPGWFVTASWHIVREISRKNQSENKKIEKIIGEFKSDFKEPENIQTDHKSDGKKMISNLREALDRINELDSEIIELRYFKGLKYEEIFQYYHQCEDNMNDCKEIDNYKKEIANLRQRCSRAVKRLRGAYETIVAENQNHETE